MVIGILYVRSQILKEKNVLYLFYKSIIVVFGKNVNGGFRVSKMTFYRLSENGS